MKILRTVGILLTLLLLAFLSLASQYAAPMTQATTTPISKARATAMALEAQAGHSDGILLLGVLIFVFIATPILWVRFKKPGTNAK